MHDADRVRSPLDVALAGATTPVLVGAPAQLGGVASVATACCVGSAIGDSYAGSACSSRSKMGTHRHDTGGVLRGGW